MDEEKIVSLYEDTRHLANVAVWAVDLQVKRLEANELEFADFPFQPLVDFHFLVTALTRLQKIAEALKAIEDIELVMEKAIESFEKDMPGLRNIRNVLEHTGEYARGVGHNQDVQYGEMFTVVLDPDCIQWLGYELRPSAALSASDVLFHVIKENPPAAYVRAVDSQRSKNR
ncbi:MAG: hypothetical protein ACYDCF_05890 [Burkholderiales bacterium]